VAATLSSPDAAATPVRETIRSLLMASAEYQALEPEARRDIARGLVQISSTARALADAEVRAPGSTDPAKPGRYVRPLNAGSEFSGVAADRVAGTTKAILNAVSFPRFVNELIIGVFKALLESNQQQMHEYVELIKNVAATTDGFADANIGVQGAREWLAERFAGSFVIEGEVDDFETPGQPLTKEEQAERDASTRLRLKPGASMPSEGALKTALGLGPQDSLPGSDPESLVALARASLARSRQQMLSSMVMMGMQRIVIESGRLSASMRFHIDTRSAAADDRGSTFDVRNESDATVGAKFGPWGVDAKVKNTIGFVSTQRTQTTEEMNTDLDLNSSVELVFKTDYLPLDRMAGAGTVDRIRVNTLNPDAEAKIATDERKARREAQGKAEDARRSQVSDRMKAPPPSAPSAPPPALNPAGKAAGNPPGDAAAKPPEQSVAKPPEKAVAKPPANVAVKPPANAGATPPGGAGGNAAVKPR
jgi:hypothetical protein